MLELVGLYSIGLSLKTSKIFPNGVQLSSLQYPSAIVSEFPQQYADAEPYETPYEREVNQGDREARDEEEDLDEMRRRDFENYEDEDDDYHRDDRYEENRDRREREKERIEDQIEELENRLEELDGRYLF